jgi:hypothetical protein
MFDNFARFFSNGRNKERVVAILTISIGIFLLNQAGLYGEEVWTKRSEPREKERETKETKETKEKEKQK